MRCRQLLGSLLLTSLIGGCRPTEGVTWHLSAEVKALSEKLQQPIATILEQQCGTPNNPKLLGNPQVDAEHLHRGAAVFNAQCASCHGVTGDGAGPAATALYPRPRDYRKGIFKFSSTPFGAKPLREDLVRTVRQGAKGTSMPSFKFMPEEDLQAVIDYVLVLTHRGELETFLAFVGESDDEIDPEAVPEYVAEIKANWSRAPERVIHPLTPEPKFTPESIELGRRAFATETAGCFKCHGLDGRGKTTDNATGFKDSWGFQARAADLTSGMFHGGGQPEDIYRRIYGGISGTPMPSFKEKLAAEPETFWHLVHYVRHVSNQRRLEVQAQVKRQQQPLGAKTPNQNAASPLKDASAESSTSGL